MVRLFRKVNYLSICAFVFAIAMIFFVQVESWAVDSVTDSEEYANYGVELYCLVNDILTGNLGTLAGLLIAFSGFVMFILNGGRSNVATIIIGIAITAYPGLYRSFLMGMTALEGVVNGDQYSTLTVNCESVDITIEDVGNPYDIDTGAVFDDDGYNTGTFDPDNIQVDNPYDIDTGAVFDGDGYNAGTFDPNNIQVDN